MRSHFLLTLNGVRTELGNKFDPGNILCYDVCGVVNMSGPCMCIR